MRARDVKKLQFGTKVRVGNRHVGMSEIREVGAVDEGDDPKFVGFQNGVAGWARYPLIKVISKGQVGDNWYTYLLVHPA